MLTKIKKILFNISKILKPIKKQQLNNDDIIYKLEELRYTKNINSIFLSSTGKLALMNMHTNNYYELLNNIYNSNYNNTMMAINVDKYFKEINGYIDISSYLNRIIMNLKEIKHLNSFIKQDLEELINTFDYLNNMR